MFNLLAFSMPLLSDREMASTDILLLHSGGAAAGISAAVLLGRSILRSRRGGDIPRGFTFIAALFFLSSVARMLRVLCTWSGLTRPFWLDAIVLPLLLFAVLSAPLLLTAYARLAASHADGRANRQPWAMLASLCAIVALFALAVACGVKTLPTLIASAGCILAALLLWLRASDFKRLPLRQRGLMLFSALSTAGLLGIAIDLFVAYRWSISIFDSPSGALAGEFCSMLLVLGMMFVFSSLRYADLILKRVVTLYLWLAASLMLWKVVKFWSSSAPALRGHAEFGELFSLAAIALTFFLAPRVTRLAAHWIDTWVFEAPNYSAITRRFWEQTQELEQMEALFLSGSSVIQSTLGLAAVRVAARQQLPPLDALGTIAGSSPLFLPPGSPLALAITPHADVLLPLYLEGKPDYWLTLSRGPERPPWTASELEFVSRIADGMQTRMAAVLAAQRRLERITRESALREQVASAELRALRAQINPHFLFNSLNTIADLTVVAPQKAEEMTLRLAAVFRYVLVNADRQFTTLDEEIRFSKDYLDIEKARFEDRLQIHFAIDDELLQQAIPTLLLQPLIENAIKHGLSPRRQGGTLSISARRLPGAFELLVADDGVGLDYSGERPTGSGAHIGVGNVKKRLATAYNGRASFELVPRAGGGAEARIVIHTQREPFDESSAG